MPYSTLYSPAPSSPQLPSRRTFGMMTSFEYTLRQPLIGAANFIAGLALSL
jgi:hypothetical protein